MSKKILSLALAVVMLFSVCSVAVSAADLSADQVGIWLDTNATVGMEAGESVWVKVYFKVPTVDGYTHGNSNVCLAFTDAFAVDTVNPNNTTLSYDAREWGASYEQYFKETSSVNTFANTFTGVKNNFTANDSQKNWAGAAIIQQQTNTDNGFTTTSGYPIDPDCEVFTLYFKTTRRVEATDSIGVPEGTAAKQTVMKYILNGSQKTYTAAQIVLSDSYVYAKAPSYDVYSIGGKNDEVAVKKSNGNGTYNIGTFFAFKAATIDPEFNAIYRSENITGITATITATKTDDSTVSVDPANIPTINYVYDVSTAKDKSELGFVIAINNIPDAEDSIKSYTITPVMQTRDGKTYSCPPLTVNVADRA